MGMEKKLDKALQKFNEALAQNKTLRGYIDSLHKERVVFDGIYKKLEYDLHKKKKEMAAIIEDSKNAQRRADRSQRSLDKLKQGMDDEIVRKTLRGLESKEKRLAETREKQLTKL